MNESDTKDIIYSNSFLDGVLRQNPRKFQNSLNPAGNSVWRRFLGKTAKFSTYRCSKSRSHMDGRSYDTKKQPQSWPTLSHIGRHMDYVSWRMHEVTVKTRVWNFRGFGFRTPGWQGENFPSTLDNKKTYRLALMMAATSRVVVANATGKMHEMTTKVWAHRSPAHQETRCNSI